MSKKIIQPGEGNVKIALPLVSFDMIIDTDYGLLKMVREEYLDPSVFDPSWFTDKQNTINLTRALYSRPDVNPLTLCIKDHDKEEELYRSFMKESYDNIIRISGITDFMKVIQAWNLSKAVHPTIVCNDPIELQLLSVLPMIDERYKWLELTRKVLLSDLVTDDSVEFSAYYFKSVYNDIYLDTLVDNIKVKPVYFAYYPFNTAESPYCLLSESARKLLKNKNEIRLVDIYNRETLDLELTGGNENE